MDQNLSNILGGTQAMADATEPTRGAQWDALPYSTKRHGTSITDCDAEPVRTPGV